MFPYWLISCLSGVLLFISGVAPTMGESFSPQSRTELLLAAAAKQVSTLHAVYRYSWQGQQACTIMLIADLDTNQIDATKMYPLIAGRAEPFPPIIHWVSDGKRAWWGHPNGGPGIVPGSWCIKFFPSGAPLNCPGTTDADLGLGQIKKALIPWTVRNQWRLRHLPAGFTLSVRTQLGKIKGRVRRTYTCWRRGREFSKEVCAIALSGGVRVYSTTLRVMVGGRMRVMRRQRLGMFRMINGVWFPLRITSQVRNLATGVMRLPTQITFSHVEINPILPSGAFEYTAPEGSEIYDESNKSVAFVHYPVALRGAGGAALIRGARSVRGK